MSNFALSSTAGRQNSPELRTWPNALSLSTKMAGLSFAATWRTTASSDSFGRLLAAERAAADGRVLHLQYSERVILHEADQATHRRVYERAGPKAFEDYWAKRPQHRNRWP